MLKEMLDTFEKLADEAVVQAEGLVHTGKEKYEEYVRVRAEMAERKAEEARLKAEEEERALREQEAAELQAEIDRVENERAVLSKLSEKELLVEIVLALNGYNSELTRIKTLQDTFSEEIDQINSEQEHMQEQIDGLEKKVDNNNSGLFGNLIDR